MTPIKAKIDVTKIFKDRLFKGAKGTYLDIVIWPNKDGKDAYGNTHVIKQSLSREARDAGEKEQIIGNLTMPEDEAPAPRQQQRPPATRPKPPADPDLDSAPAEIPF